MEDESEWASKAYRQPGHIPFNIGDVTKRARAKATGRSEIFGGSMTSKNTLDKKNTGRGVARLPSLLPRFLLLLLLLLLQRNLQR